MSRKIHCFTALLGTFLLIAAPPVMARAKIDKLAEKLLFGDNSARTKAVKEFNQLPPEAQERLVPDFMVALSDDDPQVRKIAARILKAMGVKTGGEIPDAKQALTDSTTPQAGANKWSDLEKMRAEDSGDYADMKRQLEIEKRGPVKLDPTQLRSDPENPSTALSAVTDSLKDPDPWVRAQAARRVGMIQPAPVEAIPLLIKMLDDKETESRRAAVAALGSFGHLAQEAVIPLNAAMSDPDSVVRTLAGDALKQIQQR